MIRYLFNLNTILPFNLKPKKLQKLCSIKISKITVGSKFVYYENYRNEINRNGENTHYLRDDMFRNVSQNCPNLYALVRCQLWALNLHPR